LLWSAVTAALRGAIGAACDVPETATVSKAAAVIAKTVRVISVLLVYFSSGANLCQRITHKNDGGSADDVNFTFMNGQSESFLIRERCSRIKLRCHSLF
jgi:phage tail sheath gpL-like